MSIAISTVYDMVISHAQTTGIFDAVNGHEPKSAPSNHITCSIWLNNGKTTNGGLNKTAALLRFNVRLQYGMFVEPADRIDPELITALDLLMTNYIGDLTLGGSVMSIDVRGIEGDGITWTFGYIELDKKLFRVLDISLPVIAKDIWSEAP